MLAAALTGLVGTAGGVAHATAEQPDNDLIAPVTVNEGAPTQYSFAEQLPDPENPNESLTYEYVVTEGLVRDPGSETATRRCWIANTQIETTSLRLTQHIWEHEVHWCFNGGRAAGAHVNNGNNLYTGTFWHWRGAGANQHNYNRGSFMDVRKQGHHEWCAPKTGCAQNQWPLHEGHYYNGYYVTTILRKK